VIANENFCDFSHGLCRGVVSRRRVSGWRVKLSSIECYREVSLCSFLTKINSCDTSAFIIMLFNVLGVLSYIFIWEGRVVLMMLLMLSLGKGSGQGLKKGHVILCS